MKDKLVLALLLFSGLSVFGQFHVADYLSAPFRDAEISGLSEQMDFMQDESFRSPLFRDMEVRLRTNDLNFSAEEVRLRLGFMNPMEQRANRFYENTQSEYLQLKYNFEANQIIANRYKQLIRHYFLSSYKDLLTAEINQLQIAYEQMQLTKVSFKDWAETDEKILEKELKGEDVRTSMDILESRISEIIDFQDSISWGDFEFITVQKMQEVLLPDTTVIPMSVRLAMKTYELGQMSYKVEKAQSWGSIGYIQAEYNLESTKQFDESLGFQVGVSLPIFNSDKPKLQRKKLALMEKEYEVKEVENESSREQDKLNNEFRKYIRNYQKLRKRLDEVELLGENISYETMEEYLALINYHGKLRMLKNDAYLNCLNTYIEILALSGRLSEAPFVNYISNELSHFSIDKAEIK